MRSASSFQKDRGKYSMLSRENFTSDHIEDLRKEYGNDPALLERTVFAFGLLDAIREAEMPFIFKGGTSLLILLENPKRLSTDIDIIVKPGTDVDRYIQAAGKTFPFKNVEEDVRRGGSNIEKRHYKFLFESPLTHRPINILLDVLFEENPYSTIVERPITNSLLIATGDPPTVKVPGVNCILGDKLTAFAPHTAGVLLSSAKYLEIIKQMFDCWTLFQKMDDFTEVTNTYQNVVKKELAYRDQNLLPSDVLIDTVRSCLCIIGRGSVNASEYSLYRAGIGGIGSHILSLSFNGQIAALYACHVLYLAASILTNKECCPRIEDPERYEGIELMAKNARRVNSVKFDLLAYAYLIEAYNMLGPDLFVLK